MLARISIQHRRQAGIQRGVKMMTDTIGQPYCIEINDYRGQWVAIIGGQVVAHDRSLRALMHRTTGTDAFVEYQYVLDMNHGGC
jgi:hypothetical protein